MTNSESLSIAIDALLPQTQCRKCGYPACGEYAGAISAGEAGINRCPPGGDATIRELADLLNVQLVPLDTTCGEHKPPEVAIIDESTCIGCTLCIQVCPVDAIVGAARQMHTVIADECTGCELCIPPCPVDCIDMKTITAHRRTDSPSAAEHFRRRFLFRQRRLAQLLAEKKQRRARILAARATKVSDDPRKAVIAAAIERARSKRQGRKPLA